MTARAHDCEDILQPAIRPRGDADSLELSRLKNDFLYSIFNKCLLCYMGKTIVRKNLDNMNAERVWDEFSTHMTTFSMDKAEKRRLHTYVTTTVWDNPGKVPLSSSFSTSMNSSDNWTKFLPLRSIYIIPLDWHSSKLLPTKFLSSGW